MTARGSKVVAGAAPDDEIRPIRVMIVDDSRIVRSIVSGWLGEEAGIDVVATHGDGRSASEDILRTNPDVVVLDIEMPGMDGLTALPLLLRRRPETRVLIVSTLTTRGAAVSLEALTRGAADYVAKPDAVNGSASNAFRTELVSKVRLLGEGALGPRVGAPGRNNGRRTSDALPTRRSKPAPREVARGLERRPARPSPAASSRTRPAVVVIASSTGGPQALMNVFGQLGPAMDATAVLVAQHMPPTFTAILAEHIARVAGRPAREGEHGEWLEIGTVRVAPGGRHMTVVVDEGRLRLRLTDGPPVNFCKPSADVLFRSAAVACGPRVLGLVLTGMGSDGALGARAIVEAGGSVIAQDEATSVVWGMPRAVVQAGVASDVLPLERIGARAAGLLTGCAP